MLAAVAEETHDTSPDLWRRNPRFRHGRPCDETRGADAHRRSTAAASFTKGGLASASPLDEESPVRGGYSGRNCLGPGSRPCPGNVGAAGPRRRAQLARLLAAPAEGPPGSTGAPRCGARLARWRSAGRNASWRPSRRASRRSSFGRFMSAVGFTNVWPHWVGSSTEGGASRRRGCSSRRMKLVGAAILATWLLVSISAVAVIAFVIAQLA